MTTTEPTEPTAVEQPTFGLPEFDGIVPVGVLTNLTGAGQRIHRAIHHGEKVVLLVEAEVTDVRHPKTKEGVKRKHVLSVVDLFELEGKAGQRVLTTMRQQYRAADDARLGRAPLFGDDGPQLTPQGWVAADGTVLTEADLAEVRGEALLAAANDPSLDAVVVVFVDGGEMKWPEEFGPVPGGRPKAGQLLADPEPRLVREIRDADGVVLESVSDEELERLLGEIEAAERARVAEEDAAAVADLMLAREEAKSSAPWPDYDSFSVPTLKGLIDEITERAEVEAVLGYERSHKKRSTVLSAAQARLAELES